LVIYVDSSVLLAELIVEARTPPETLWEEHLASSRLLLYEVWNRLDAYGLMVSHGDRARSLLARINLTAMSEPALARALRPFPISIRTLDSLHLATIEYLRSQGDAVELASYDNRMLAAAEALGIPVTSL
jgi:hypothetical protein